MKFNATKNEKHAYNKGYRAFDDGSIIGKNGNKLNLWMRSMYLHFSVKKDNKVLKIPVHRFIAYIKYGDKLFEKGIVARHLDGNHLNNNFNNIEIGTQSDNKKDMGKDNSPKDYTKYSDDEIKSFIEYYKNGHTLLQTKEHYNISSVGKLRNYIYKYESK